MYKGKKVLITGGTGSLGKALTKKLLDMDVETVRILSRNEDKQIAMENEIKDDRLRFFLGDIRDKERLIQSFESIDIVFHAAALKHVPKIEYNPFESIKTNIIGSQNVIDASIAQDVERVVCIGTDKAVSPLNTYGATKLIMEKLFVSANNYLSEATHRTKFFAVRYGNVLGSNGSVVRKFIELLKSGKPISITDERMTRFTISMNDALNFILNSTKIAKGSEIFIPKMVAYDMKLLTSTLYGLFQKTNEEIIGIRPGEKLHEVLINTDELQYTYEINDIFVILSPLIHQSINSSVNMRNFSEKELNDRYPGIKKITDMESYSSDSAKKISKDELTNKIKELENFILKQ